MIFSHRKTKKPALWITPYDSEWENQEDPNLYRIKKWEDIPESIPYKDITVAYSILENQGKKAFYLYLQAFLIEEDCENDFWFLVMPSGFPDGTIPVE